ncbi:MAG: ParB/RepB/Spo0J family partition protein [Nanoarchaeota archaeon]|nr:ParB/RepB/Spo0J family partition protein [Nanoarchaeota archaeon]
MSIDKYKRLDAADCGLKNVENIEFIQITQLKLPKDRVRKSINREDISLMAANLKLFGILQPLEINSKNEVILGTRRFEAAKLASLQKVPVIRRTTNQIFELEKQLVSDLHSKHISLLERAQAFQKLLELKSISKYELARYLSLSNNLICRTLAILNASPETMNLIKQGRISQRVVAAVLYRLKDKSKEKYIINKIIKEKLSVAQAENLVAELNDSNILQKHFLKQAKSFRTSLTKFKEKSDISNMDKKQVEKELEKIIESIRSI